MITRSTRHAAAAAGFGLVTLFAPAGELDPPGAPAPTQALIEPRIPVGPSTTPGVTNAVFAIDTPGSYYLTGDVAGESGKSAISIRTSGVTLDLNGFALRGVPGAFHAVSIVQNSPTDVTIRNGVLADWPSNGVNGSGAVRVTVEDLHVESVGTTGINVGAQGRVARCSIAGAVSNGILVGEHSLDEHCVVRQCGGDGIAGVTGAVVRGCAVDEAGDDGIVLGLSGVAESCTLTGGGGDGISTGAGSTVRGCTAQGNGSAGFRIGSSSTVVDCVALQNRIGFDSEAQVTFAACTAQQNSPEEGFDLGAGNTATGCTAASNTSDGFFAGTGSTVQGCTARSNTGDGIHTTSDGLILNNVCASNGFNGDGAGILASASGNRIDGNHVANNDRGIDINGTGNIILRNTARTNTTDFDIFAGNDTGDIIDLTGVQGEFATGTAWSNFRH